MPPLIWLTAGCWAVFVVVWAVMSFRAKASVRRGIGGGGVLWRLGVFLIALIIAKGIALGWIPRTIFPYGVRVAGVALTAMGVAFAVWARLTLGSNWGMPMTVRENPELVTSGPYAFVRHPIYTGIIFAFLGTAMTVGPWWAFVLVVGFCYFAVSARREERDMIERFPDAYPAYRARTKMLIPFVY